MNAYLDPILIINIDANIDLRIKKNCNDMILKEII